MNCKECSCEVTESEARKVASWYFCEPCFKRLFEKKSVDKPAAVSPKIEAIEEESSTSFSANDFFTAASPEPRSDESSFSSLAGNCSMCGVEINDENYDSLGSLKICSSCMTDMRGSFAKVDKPVKKEVEKKPKEPDNTPRDLLGRIHVGLDKELSCTGCGRTIPVGGAREVDDQKLCPECFYKGNS